MWLEHVECKGLRKVWEWILLMDKYNISGRLSHPGRKNLQKPARFLQGVQVSCTSDFARQMSYKILALGVFYKCKILQDSCTRYISQI